MLVARLVIRSFLKRSQQRDTQSAGSRGALLDSSVWLLHPAIYPPTSMRGCASIWSSWCKFITFRDLSEPNDVYSSIPRSEVLMSEMLCCILGKEEWVKSHQNVVALSHPKWLTLLLQVFGFLENWRRAKLLIPLRKALLPPALHPSQTQTYNTVLQHTSWSMEITLPWPSSVFGLLPNRPEGFMQLF